MEFAGWSTFVINTIKVRLISKGIALSLKHSYTKETTFSWIRCQYDLYKISEKPSGPGDFMGWRFQMLSFISATERIFIILSFSSSEMSFTPLLLNHPELKVHWIGKAQCLIEWYIVYRCFYYVILLHLWFP